MLLGGIAYRSATVILPAYFEIKGQGIFQWLSSITGWELSKNLVATSITFLIYLVGVAGQYTGGRLAERFDPRLCYLAFHAMTVPMVLFMAIAFDFPLVILAMTYIFFLLGMQPIENTLVANFSPKRFHHSAYGIKFVLTFGIAALAVKMVGAIEIASGIEAVFTAMGMISLALVGVIVLLLRNTRRLW
jgi:predicted MFS family arabinose efflux permease